MSSNIPQDKLRTVDIIVYPGFKALEAIGPLKVFDYTNSCLHQRNLAGGYEVAIASTKTGMIPSDTLMSLQATKATSIFALPDLALIVGSPDIEQALQDSPEIVEWVESENGNPTLKTTLAVMKALSIELPAKTHA